MLEKGPELKVSPAKPPQVRAFYLECAQVMMVGHNTTKTEAAYRNVTALVPPKECPKPPRVRWIAINTANVTEAAAAVEATVEAFGQLDIAVNNAGSAGNSNRSEQIGDDGFIDYFDHSLEMSVNVYGTLNCMNAQLQSFRKSGGGVMVNVASICGEIAACGPSYTTSKWAEIGFSRQAALKYAPSGIRINVLAPGPVDTPMLRGGRAEVVEIATNFHA